MNIINIQEENRTGLLYECIKQTKKTRNDRQRNKNTNNSCLLDIQIIINTIFGLTRLNTKETSFDPNFYTDNSDNYVNTD